MRVSAMENQGTLLDASSRHLREARVSYVQHMGVAFGIGWRMLRGGVACLVHGLVPGLFTTKASTIVKELHGEIHSRHQDPRAARYQLEWEI